MNTRSTSVCLSFLLGKNNAKICRAEAALGRFHLDGAEVDAPWLLTGDQLKIAAERLQSVLVPAYLDCNPSSLFSRCSRLKSHDWKQVYIVGYTYTKRL